MAETSGFFQAMWDDSLTNPTTGQNTGWWDRSYLAEEFMKYFSLLVGNGVFASPVNQLLVIPGAGSTVIVSEGWAFINGGWYHNDGPLVLDIARNGSSTSRVDSVRVRLSAADRKISALVVTGSSELVRGDTVWELEIAQVIVDPNVVTIAPSKISDTRPDGSVCGFVTGLLEVVSAADLFQQFQGIFNEWFDTVKNQVTGDLAIRLQTEFDELNLAVINYQAAVEEDIANFENAMRNQQTTFQQEVTDSVNAIQQTATNAYNTMNGFVEKDFVIPKRTLTFTNLVCTITDSRVTSDSLVDVYFTKNSMVAAENARIYVDSENGKIVLTASSQPSANLEALIRVRVR